MRDGEIDKETENILLYFGNYLKGKLEPKRGFVLIVFDFAKFNFTPAFITSTDQKSAREIMKLLSESSGNIVKNRNEGTNTVIKRWENKPKKDD